MSRMGYQLFLGPPDEAIGFFKDLANVDSDIFPDELQEPHLSRQTSENPAEMLLDVASLSISNCLIQMEAAFRNSQAFKDIERESVQLMQHKMKSIREIEPLAMTSSCWAFWLLFKRSSRNVFRDPMLLVAHILVTAVIAIAIAIFARNLPLDFLGVQTRAFLFNFLVVHPPHP